MIYDYIVESANLYEELLDEDRMVKYDGELAPKFGWCVIYVGGPGSGKGSSTKFKSRLEGDYYNVDNLKEIERMWDIKPTNKEKTLPSKEGDLPGMRYRSSDFAHKDNFTTPSEIVPKLDKEGNQIYDKNTGEPVYYDKHRNMGNSEFVSELHDEMSGLGKKWKSSILDNPENREGRERLPNIIFDITGDKVSKLTAIIDKLKPIGYKIAIIWILSTPERAMRNNSQRDRKVDLDKVFLPKHISVIKAIKELFASGEIEKVDEFWVIDSATEINPSTDPVAYHDAQNVYHIPTTKDGLLSEPFVAKRVAYAEKEFERIINKRQNLL